MHMVYLEAKMSIYPACNVQIVLLLAEKVIILSEYLDFTDDFSKKSAIKLSEYSVINEHLIGLETSKQLFYSLIYSLDLVELKTLKTYIKTHLANGFIQLSKSPVRAPILFD